jgi:rare lipoprotein A
VGEVFKGIASWYGPNFHGKLTANGEIYNMYAYTAANKFMPMNTIVKVTNLNNFKSVIVRINDRGPFVKGRIIDLSYAAGKKIGLDKSGTAPVELEVLRVAYKNPKKLKQTTIKTDIGNIKLALHPKHTKKYKIQVGVFKHLSGAKIFKREFGNMVNKRVYIKKSHHKYKVFIGDFSSYKQAKAFKQRNSIKGFITHD